MLHTNNQPKRWWFIENNLLKLENKHSELQQYSARNIFEILGLPDIFTGNGLMKKVTELFQ